MAKSGSLTLRSFSKPFAIRRLNVLFECGQHDTLCIADVFLQDPQRGLGVVSAIGMNESTVFRLSLDGFRNACDVYAHIRSAHSPQSSKHVVEARQMRGFGNR